MAVINSTQYAGEVNLEYIKIYSSEGVFADITDIVVSINIFEDIFSTAMTCNLVVVDNLNLIEKLPIIGQEFVEMKLSTPQLNETADSVIEKKFVINTIASRESISVGAQAYSFELSTQDSIVNRKTRVSKSYTGSISDTVFDVLRNELGSLQDINVEPTLGIRKIVVPNNHPYTIINQLKKEAISKEYGSPHYVFFENKLGLNFTSLQSLYNEGVRAKLHSGDKDSDISIFLQSTKKEEDDPVKQSHMRVLSHSFNHYNDIGINLDKGMLGSKLTTHDIFNKKYDVYTRDYFDNFQDFERIETIGFANPVYNKQLKEDFGNFEDSVLKLHPVTGQDKDEQYYVDGVAQYDSARTKDTMLERDAKVCELNNGNSLNIKMNGNTFLTVGDLIDISIPITGEDHDNEQDEASTSGLYLITQLRHKIAPQQKQHEISMKVYKDCTKKELYTNRT